MCGRACCSLAPDVIQKAMDVGGGRWRDKDKYVPGYNLGEGSFFPVVFCTAQSVKTEEDVSSATPTPSGHSSSQGLPLVEVREMASMKWGLIPFWSRAGEQRQFKTINARAETIMKKRTYKDLVPHKRCVVVVEGFYEWENYIPSQGVVVKRPHFFHRPDRKLLALAGLYDCWKDGEGRETWSFTMITTAAAPNLTWCHDRMPVLLDDASIDTWLRCGTYSPGAALAVLKPDPGLTWYNVASLVNSMNNNSPECVQPIEMRAKRSSPSSSPKRSGRSPQTSKQPKIESFVSVKRESGHGDESGVKNEPTSISSFSPSLPPPSSPYRPRVDLQFSRQHYSQRTSSVLPPPASPKPSATVSAQPSTAKRKRDENEETKADESARSSKVLLKDTDKQQAETKQEGDAEGQEQEIHRPNPEDADSTEGIRSTEPWDEDSFPYYLVDDPTLSNAAATPAEPNGASTDKSSDHAESGSPSSSTSSSSSSENHNSGEATLSPYF